MSLFKLNNTIKTNSKKMQNTNSFIFFCFISVLLSNVLLAQKEDKDITKVKSILLRQSEDWNRGDINSFMKGYWKSDQLKFIGSNGVIYGYEATLARYKKNYPDQKAMGTLKFDIINTEKLSTNVILIVGKFTLTKEIGDASGYFSLTWKKIGKEWLIIADHTS